MCVFIHGGVNCLNSVPIDTSCKSLNDVTVRKMAPSVDGEASNLSS